MRLEEVKKGDILWLGAPGRIAKVLGRTTVDVKKRGTRDVTTQSAVRALVTVARVPIKGFLTDEDATALSRPVGDVSPPKIKPWQEVWTERSVPVIVKVKGRYATPSEDDFIQKLFCIEQTGRPKGHERTSPVVGRNIEGKFMPKADVPKEIFEEAEAALVA